LFLIYKFTYSRRAHACHQQSPSASSLSSGCESQSKHFTPGIQEWGSSETPEELFGTFRRLADIQTSFNNWSRMLGPLPSLRSTMLQSYQEAVSADEVDEWRAEHFRWVDEGRYISAMLVDLAPLEMPTKAWQLQELWTRAMGLSALVQEGIASLETWIMALSGR
jgi:hypothetical protein